MMTFLIDGATRPGYDPSRHLISQLSLGNRGWLGTTNLIVGGLFIVGFSIGLRRVVPPGRGSVWGPRLISIIGWSILAAGLFPPDTGFGYPAGVTPSHTIHGLLHTIAGLTLLTSITAAFYVFLPRAAQDNPWRGTTAYGAIGGAVTGLASIGGIIFLALAKQGHGLGYAGLMERVALITGISGIVFLAWTYRLPADRQNRSVTSSGWRLGSIRQRLTQVVYVWAARR
jgi:hypothetical membrane protein